MLSTASSHCILTTVVTFILKFGGDLELKRLDFTWSGQVDSVDLTAATLRSDTEDSAQLSSRVANRPEFFRTVPNSAAVSRVPNGSIRDISLSRIEPFGTRDTAIRHAQQFDGAIRDRLMSRISTVQTVMSTRILISGF